uniref:MD-2-related lipid-recognition domain-containing protein n=2 Tax=Strongyloides stercoralis TaxID=6248 RepID=A0AAF5CYG5_STRER
NNMDAWKIEAILDKVPINKKGKKQYLYKVRWANSLVTADDFPDKSILIQFEKKYFNYEIIGPVKKGKGGSLIDITNISWLIQCKQTGEQKEQRKFLIIKLNMKAFIIIFATVSIVNSLVLPRLPSSRKTCQFPNGTDTNLHFYNCDSKMPLTILNVKVKNQSNDDMYPIDPRKPIKLELVAKNNGIQIDDNHVKVNIYEYTTNWLSGECSWIEIPTFGLLNNIDGCDYAHNCPLIKGPLTLDLPLDLSSYSSIIELLAGSKPYQLVIRMYNYSEGNNKHEEFACVTSQLRFAE